ncbi:MAG: formylglycine-generating enzyme family protein, partial [Verrucomicrobia bacterium]|nr:formylglycine-generating enzyme family protein [Verrucomicrobiota bacterium]
MSNFKLTSGLLVLALAGMTAQAAAPSLSYEVNGNELIINYTGTLLQSTDAVNWTEVASASSPYKVALSDKQLFFCTQGGGEVQPVMPCEDFSTPLSDGLDLDMNWVYPGTFLMGSPEDELGRSTAEVQHQVTLTRGYWLGKYEVTQAQYVAVTGKNNPSWFHGDDERPVERVSWEEAMEFCAILTERDREAGRLPQGYEYRLPTEAQWEYACRAGTTTAFNNGTNIETEEQIYGACPNLDPLGWYSYNSENTTHPAGEKQPNAWGFYDMHGNVEEWCLDWFDSYPDEAVTNPAGPETGAFRVIRGGSYSAETLRCRSASRSSNYATDHSNTTGFRVALVTVAEIKDMTIPLAENVNLDMNWIEPGTFIIGSPEDELGREDDETQHKVTLTRGYWMGKYEVTQSQYEAVMGKNPSSFKGSDLPVEKVSWNDAMEFCAKLTAIEKAAGRLPEGFEYTLPTEAQWEYA